MHALAATRTNANTLKQILSLDEKYISISINLHGKDMTYYTDYDTQCHNKWLTMGFFKTRGHFSVIWAKGENPEMRDDSEMSSSFRKHR